MENADQTTTTLSRDDVLREQIREGHASDAELVKSSKLRQEDLYLISPARAKLMTVHFTADSLEDFKL